jgi:hypothetical protein
MFTAVKTSNLAQDTDKLYLKDVVSVSKLVACVRAYKQLQVVINKNTVGKDKLYFYSVSVTGMFICTFRAISLSYVSSGLNSPSEY